MFARRTTRVSKNAYWCGASQHCRVSSYRIWLRNASWSSSRWPPCTRPPSEKLFAIAARSFLVLVAIAARVASVPPLGASAATLPPLAR